MDSLVSAIHPQEIEKAIRQRAEALYVERGKVPGHEVEDWLRAEAEVTREIVATAKLALIVIRVGATTYTGQYDVHCCAGYAPGEIPMGSPVEVRFQEGYMFVKRANGRELKAKIVKKTTERRADAVASVHE